MNPSQPYHPATDAAGRTAIGSGGGSAAGRRFHSVCWKAIVAGTVAALGIQLILTMFGAGIAAANINPASEPSADATPYSIGAAAWLVISGVISFGIGGMVAGCASLGHHNSRATEEGGVVRLDDAHSGRNGALHGALTWALAAVLGAMMTVAAGATLGAGGAAGTGAAAGGGAARSGSMFGWSGWGVPAAQNGWSFDTRQPGAATAGGTAGTLSAADRGITVVGPYGQRRTVTEAEARAMAEAAASAASKAILTTAVAFALAMAAASLGGMLGRQRAERRHGYVYA